MQRIAPATPSNCGFGTNSSLLFRGLRRLQRGQVSAFSRLVLD